MMSRIPRDSGLARRLLSRRGRRRARNELAGCAPVLHHGDDRAGSRRRSPFHRRRRDGAHRAHDRTDGRGPRPTPYGSHRRGPLSPCAREGVTMRQADVAGGALDDDAASGERRLLDGLRRGEPAAENELVERYAARAYRLAIAITRNAADAEEVVQDALWSAIRKIDTFRGDAALGSWLYRIVTNAACQKVRRTAHRRAEISLEEVVPAFHEDDPVLEDWSERLDDPSLRSDLRAALSAAIDELSPEYRAVVVLRDVEGLA